MGSDLIFPVTVTTAGNTLPGSSTLSIPPFSTEHLGFDQDENKKHQGETNIPVYLVIGTLFFTFLFLAWKSRKEEKVTSLKQKKKEIRREMNDIAKASKVKTHKLPLNQNFESKRAAAVGVELKEPKERKEHPLEKASKTIKQRRSKRSELIQSKGIKRSRAGTSDPPKPPLLESYDLTYDLPYSDIKVYNVPGDGDCLFHCFSLILRGLNVHKTVYDLRQIVARNTSQKEFDYLRELYLDAWKSGDRGLLEDYIFMQNVYTLQDLRMAIMKPSYYGDEMALRALEKAFPVECLVIQSKGKNKIQLARRFNENQQKPWFALLFLDTHTQHYELMTYKDKPIMRLNDLPPKIQRLQEQQKLEHKES